MNPTHVDELSAIIKKEFGWHKARCTCFAFFVLGVLAICTTTLSKISTTFSGGVQLDSRQKRLKRFLVWLAPRKDYKLIFGKLVLRRFKDRRLTLSIDRTNWKFGACYLNFLVVGVWYHGVSIPIYWINLGAAGNSNTGIRIETFTGLLKGFPSTQVEWVLGDREFVGEEWFRYLIKSKIPFVIRIKDNVWAKARRGRYHKRRKVAELFHSLKPGKTKVINSCEVYGCTVNLAACLSSEGDLVVVATNRDARKALKAYKKRWSIESLFSCLKGRGFNFEDTHIVDPKRGEALLLVLSFALFWTLQVGSETTKKKPLELAKHGRPRISLFRRGLDFLRESIIQVHVLMHQILMCINILRRLFKAVIGKI